ncbi:MAG: hypothetical protein IKB16_04640 [Lentisphaeria bacterium]|nr:hypothetical protein [Lentisphaeria bacterium]
MLVCCIGMTGYLLFSNYQNVRLFKQAQNNFELGGDEALTLAESQLLEVIRIDADNEEAYIMLGAIAEKRKTYPEQVYYCYTAHRLNPLSAENKKKYIRSLFFARYFDRLETLLSHESSLNSRQEQLLLYAASRNGSFHKYKHLAEKEKTSSYTLGSLALLRQENLPARKKLDILERYPQEDAFLKQEILAVKADLYLELNDLDKVEFVLNQGYKLNFFAFAPALARFYANFRTFGKALKIYEMYLMTYHDPEIALQTAELYCLLKQTGKIADLRTHYQVDSGSTALISSYYFDALIALAKNDMTSLGELVVPLRNSIKTPLATFLYLCVDIGANDVSGIVSGYKKLLELGTYLDLQERADAEVAVFLKRAFTDKKFRDKEEQLLSLAEILYGRKPDVTIAKMIMLSNRKRSALRPRMLQDALKRFGTDPGVLKIAIEHYLNHDETAVAPLIAKYKKLNPGKQNEMLRYEIAAAFKQKKFDTVSTLFRQNYSPAFRDDFWYFASTYMRISDLQFLSQKDPLFAPYCQALILLQQGKKSAACAILEKSDAQGNQNLLFFSAKTLGENGRTHAALKQYAQISAKSSYYLTALLNMSELYVESGKMNQALTLAARAYALAPDSIDVRFCYADKLSRTGGDIVIPEVINPHQTIPPTYRNKVKRMWIRGMQARIRDFELKNQREKLREHCRQLLVVDPSNTIASEHLKKLEKMQQ